MSQRFTVLGDSIGVGVAQTMGFTSLAVSGRSVINWGLRGTRRGERDGNPDPRRSRDLLDQLARLSPGQRDIVVFGGTNDAGLGISPAEYERNLQLFIDRATAMGVTIRAWHGPVPPHPDTRNYRRIAANARLFDEITRRVMERNDIRYESFIDRPDIGHPIRPEFAQAIFERDRPRPSGRDRRIRRRGDGLHFTADSIVGSGRARRRVDGGYRMIGGTVLPPVLLREPQLVDRLQPRG